MKNIIFIGIILLLIAIAGCEKTVYVNKECPKNKIIKEVIYIDAGPRVIAYMCDGTKQFCECLGVGCPCKSTQEIQGL